MDWSITHAVNTFLWRHDVLEDPLLAYVQAAEALFLAMLIITCLFARHQRRASIEGRPFRLVRARDSAYSSPN